MDEWTFGTYQVKSLIGRGGMGEVYRAFDTSHDRMVALKLLAAHLSQDESYRARFRRECHLAARLREPHVIPIHSYGETDGRLFLDMRLVEGRDLGHVLATGGAMAPRRAVDIIGQVARALDAAHDDGLIHRDVKPSNVIIAEEDNAADADFVFVYLVDFGVARAVGDDGNSNALTQTGGAVGTFDYMPPERFAGVIADRQTDVYSLTCMLYECLTGQRPFVGADLPSLMFAHMNSVPPAASRVTPELTEAMDAVIARGMAKDPAARFPTAGGLASAARAAIRSSPRRTDDGPLNTPAPARPDDRPSEVRTEWPSQSGGAPQTRGPAPFYQPPPGLSGDRPLPGVAATPNPVRPNPSQPNPVRPHPSQPYPSQPYPSQPSPSRPNPSWPNPAQANPPPAGPMSNPWGGNAGASTGYGPAGGRPSGPGGGPPYDPAGGRTPNSVGGAPPAGGRGPSGFSGEGPGPAQPAPANAPPGPANLVPRFGPPAPGSAGLSNPGGPYSSAGNAGGGPPGTWTSSGDPTGGKKSRGPLIVAAVIALALIATLAIVLATRKSGSTGQSPGPITTSESGPSFTVTTPTTPPVTLDAKLVGLLPDTYSEKDCTVGSVADTKAVAALQCGQSTDTTNGPSVANFYRYPDLASLRSDFVNVITNNKLAKATAGCPAVGYRTWHYENTPTVAAGQMASYVDSTGSATLSWTVEADLELIVAQNFEKTKLAGLCTWWHDA